jgi:hypothetical protein
MAPRQLPGAEYFANVEWVDHLELRVEPGASTGMGIALAGFRQSRRF